MRLYNIEDYLKFQTLNNEGKTVTEISTILNIPYSTLREWKIHSRKPHCLYVCSEKTKRKISEGLKRSWLTRIRITGNCKVCGIVLTKENKRRHERICKNCSSKRYKEQYRPQYKLYNRKRSQQIKLEVFKYYSGLTIPKCCKCGYDDIRALSIDHIDGGGAEHRRKLTHKNFYNWLIKNNYPKGFQVLCMNCQFIKKWENEEWSKGGKYN